MMALTRNFSLVKTFKLNLLVAIVISSAVPAYAQRSTLSDARGPRDTWSRAFHPVSTAGMEDFPAISGGRRTRSEGFEGRDRLAGNDFEDRGSRGIDWRTDRDFSSRMPSDNYRRDVLDDLDSGLQDGVDARGSRLRDSVPTGVRRSRRPEYRDEYSDREALPLRDDRQLRDNRRYRPVDRPLEGRDPFVPAPLPRGRRDDETTTINDQITARYTNPVNVRAVRAMTADQAVQLYAEVSQKIDERHLEPSPYDLRVRRALRNLTIALDNDTFVGALGISNDSFRTDSFRDSLGRMVDSMRVTSYPDARKVMTTVMQQAQAVPGLTASIVGFEFANASLDTLDKFSGIEPSEPEMARGAAGDSGVRSASLEEEIVGIGVEVKLHAEGLLVVKALRGGPAAEAGIESGDVIIAINQTSLDGMPMAGSVDLMKGSAGSTMRMRIYRAGKGERDFTLTRRKVRVWTVNDTRLLNGTDVGYLSLSRFSQNSTAELDQALAELYKQGMKSLIIDLRGNPGGLLTTCVEVSDRFLTCGTIVSTKGRLSSDNMLEQATFERTWNQPLVVLVDGDSASASEIFAAAVQENERGVIVGTKSYGKGTVQTHFPLSAIGGNLRLTTAKFYSPNGRPMAGEGVTPDVLVDDADGIENGDEVLEAAIEIAGSRQLQEMAQAAGTCRPGRPAAARSSSLSNFNDSNSRTMFR
jgi:carboxyl-terminal processing protease